MLAHQKNNRFYLEAQAQIEVLHRCLARFDGRWQQAPETGAEFLDDDQPALADLDVFGPRSLYQFLSLIPISFPVPFLQRTHGRIWLHQSGKPRPFRHGVHRQDQGSLRCGLQCSDLNRRD